MSEKRRLVTNTLANGVAQLAGIISSIIFMPLLIRNFGIADFGLYMLAGSVGAYAALLDLGVGVSLAKMVAESAAEGDTHRARRMASTSLAFYMAIGVFAALLITLVALNAGNIFRVSAKDAELLRNLLLISAIASLWAWPANTAGSVLAGMQRFVLTARTSLASVVASIAATLVVVLTHQGPVALMAANALIGLAAASTNTYLAWVELGRGRISPLDSQRDIMRSIFGFSWAVFVVQICTVVVYQQTDRVVLGVFLGASAIGLYEAAGKFLGFVTQGVNFTNSAVLPMASNLHAAGRPEALEGLVYRGTRYVVALTTPAVLIVMILAKPLITGWLGAGFGSQALNAAILVSPWLIMVTATMPDTVLIARGLLPKRLPWVVLFSIENLVLSVVLVKHLGITGVVLGTAIPYLIDYPFHMRLLVRHKIISWSGLMRRVVLPTYPLLVVPGAIAALSLLTPIVRTLVGTALVAVLAFSAYWVLFLTMNAPERNDLLAGLQVLRRRARVATPSD